MTAAPAPWDGVTRTTRPAILAALPRSPPPTYAWDDANPEQQYARDPALRRAVEALDRKPQLALGVACSEWIARCFEERADIAFLFDLIAAAWVAVDDPKALHQPPMRWRINPTAWPGNAWRPVFITYDLLLASPRAPARTRAEFTYYLAALAAHVVPTRRPFLAWRRALLARLAAWTATAVPPQIADPAVDLGPAAARRLSRAHRESIDPRRNKFLATTR
jgi:hypothetical protein